MSSNWECFIYKSVHIEMHMFSFWSKDEFERENGAKSMGGQIKGWLDPTNPPPMLQPLSIEASQTQTEPEADVEASSQTGPGDDVESSQTGPRADVETSQTGPMLRHLG